MLTPMLPIFIMELGGSNTAVGTIVSAYAMAQLVSSAPLGIVMRRCQYTIAACLSLCVLISTALCCFWVHSLLFLFLFRLIGGVSNSAWDLSRKTYISAEVSSNVRGKVTAMIQGYQKVMVMLAAAVGGFVAQHLATRSIFLMQALLSSAALFTLLLHFSMTFVKGTEDSEEEESGGTSPTARLKNKADKNGPPQSLWTVARQHCRGLFGAGLYCSALIGLRSTWAIALPLQAISMGFSKQNIGLAVAFSRAFDVTMTLSAAGYISDNFGRKASGCPTLCLMASSFLWLPFATTTEGLMLAAMMWGIGSGLSGGVENNFATGLAPADCRTEFLGLWKMTTSVGTLCLPPMFGAVSDATGSLRMACLITGTLALFMIGWLWIAVPGESNGEPHDPEFMFVAHGDSFINIISTSWWSKKYCMLNSEEQWEHMTWFERYVIAPLFTVFFRTVAFLGIYRIMAPHKWADDPFQVWFPAKAGSEDTESTMTGMSSTSQESSDEQDGVDESVAGSVEQSQPDPSGTLGVESGGLEAGSVAGCAGVGDGSDSKLERCNGVFRLLPLLPADFFLSSRKGRFLKTMKASLPRAKRKYPNLRVIGLGALTKAAFFSDGGAEFVDVVDKLGCKLVTGNTMTAAVVFENVKRFIPRNAPVWINGATSTIGTALIIAMAQYGYDSITFHSGCEKRAAALIEKAKTRYQIPEGTLRFSSDAAEYRKFEFCILGSTFALPQEEATEACAAAPEADDDVERGAAAAKQKMMTFAFPPPPVPGLIDIGKVLAPKETAVLGHQLLCPTGTMYACAMGTAVHAIMRWEHHEYGEIAIDRLDDCWSAAKKLGFRVISEDATLNDLAGQ